MVHNNRTELEVPEQSPRSMGTEYAGEGPEMLESLEPAFDFDDDGMM